MSKIKVVFDNGMEHKFKDVSKSKKEENYLFLIQGEHDVPTVTINLEKVLFIEESFWD